MLKVSLFFENVRNKNDMDKDKFIRLKAGIQLKMRSGWTQPYSAIVDTGAHTTLIPYSIWRELKIKKYPKKHKMFGITKKAECGVTVEIGEISTMIVDQTGNQTQELITKAFLAEDDRVPLLIGFAGILERLKLVCDYKNNEAYVETG